MPPHISATYYPDGSPSGTGEIGSQPVNVALRVPVFGRQRQAASASFA